MNRNHYTVRLFLILFCMTLSYNQYHDSRDIYYKNNIKKESLFDNFFSSFDEYKKWYAILVLYLYIGKKLNTLAKKLLEKKYFFIFFLNKEHELNCGKEVLKKNLDLDLFWELKETEEKIYYFQKYKLIMIGFCAIPFIFNDLKKIIFYLDSVKHNYELITTQVYTQFHT